MEGGGEDRERERERAAQFCHECTSYCLHVLCCSPVWANSDGHTPCIGNWCCHSNQLATGVDNRGHCNSIDLHEISCMFNFIHLDYHPDEDLCSSQAFLL